MPELADPARGVTKNPPANGQSHAPSASGLESPSLFGPGGAADGATAYEVKFLLTEGQVAEVVARVTGKLALDPYADPAMGNAYLITSLYTDTSNFDVFYRTEGYNRDKFRVRRYGHTGPVFVERKTKNGDKVRKHRARINPAEVADLAAPSLNGEWAGEWFHSQLLEKRLQPDAGIEGPYVRARRRSRRRRPSSRGVGEASRCLSTRARSGRPRARRRKSIPTRSRTHCRSRGCWNGTTSCCGW